MCRRCGKEAKDVHHIIPRRVSKRDHWVNLILLCDSCHLTADNTYKSIGLTHYMKRWMIENRYRGIKND